MIALKRLIKRYGGENLQRLIFSFLRILKIYKNFILLTKTPVKKNSVNIHFWNESKNMGDAISPVIVRYAALQHDVDVNKRIKETKHLYAVGSIITAGCHDCTIWGSGILNTKILYRIKKRKLDIRAVRGPLTRMVLKEFGYEVPEVYGDPAILMPQIFNPVEEKQYDVSIVTHMNEPLDENENGYHRISICDDDYETFVREIKRSKLIVSSSLHGIIFAETYGVPAILLKPRVDLFKYYDYYYGTKRFDFPIASSVEEALNIDVPKVPDFSEMRRQVLAAFPTDLWG